MKKNLKIYRKIFSIIIYILFFNNFSYGQCSIRYTQTILSESINSIKIQGYSIGCGAITIHWNTPSSLPDKTINISDIFHETPWTIEYQSSDGLTQQMLTDNFQCASTNFSFGLQCQNTSCFTTFDASFLVTCKPPPPCPSGVTLIVLDENDVNVTSSNCLANGTYKVTTSTPIPNNMNIHWSINAITDNSINDTLTVLLANGDIKEISFTAISNDNTCVILPPSALLKSCVGTDEKPGGKPDENNCPTCQVCGGDIWCCIGWIIVFISLFVLVGAVLYLICNPADGWGWLVAIIALIALILSIWWVTAHCNFNFCTMSGVIATALAFDFALVCAVDFIPCFKFICGPDWIPGVRNWFIIMLVAAIINILLALFCFGSS